MVGSFGGEKKGWSMDLFYGKVENDMWGILGLILFGEKDYFVSGEKIFDKEGMIGFVGEKGIGLYDRG